MINLDSLTLKLFLDENKNFFINGRIQKIQQPNRHELIFFIRNSGETKKFYINFNPNFYHLCFMSEENEKKRAIAIPKSAPMFCMLLRKYIQNARIVDVKVPKYERIFEIYFEYYNELNEKSPLCLAVELMGRYSNVILYNYDNNVIIGCAHNVSSQKSRERELCGMLPYIYPPKQKKKNLLKVSLPEFNEKNPDDNLSASIAGNYHYITMPFAGEIIKLSNNSKESVYNNLIDFLSQKTYAPYISDDYSKFAFYNFKDYTPQSNVNEMIDNYFSFHQSEYIKTALKSKLIKNLSVQISKLQAVKEKQQEQIDRLQSGLENKLKADIIMTNTCSIKTGDKIVSLYDFNGQPVQIELDENKTPVENAEKYYALYKKSKSASAHALEMIKETNSRILYFEELKFFVEKSNDISELNQISTGLNGNEQNKKDELINSGIEFINYKGFKIYIGKNKKQNDYILSKISSADDMWFHPLNSAGAHILVKMNRHEILTDDIILKAAQITKEYSAQKNNSKTSIIYTRRKFVKKASDKQAFVTYKNETEIIV